MHLTRLPRLLAIALVVTSAGGCGYTEQQWQVQIDAIERERTRRDAAEDRMGKADAELEEQRSKVAALEQRLAAAGIDVERLGTDLAGATATLEDRERALVEYKARAQKLEAIRARYEALRQKLAALTDVGLTVSVRKNRMVVALPGDVLFDTGKDKIKKNGREVLVKVAEAIRSDAALLGRDYQVAGHTDSKKLAGGPFGDNLGLSTMRARQVVLFLTESGGGGLPKERWSAAGYGENDPIGPNDTDEGRQANRRCEIVVVPSVDELLDLKSLSTAPMARPAAAPAAAPSQPKELKLGAPPAEPKPAAAPAKQPKPAAAPAKEPKPKDAKPKDPKPAAPPKEPKPKKAPTP